MADRLHPTPFARAVAAAAAMLGLATGCGVMTTLDGSQVAAQQAMGCEQADSFAFVGEVVPSQIGLGDWVRGMEGANQPALIVVTAEPVDMNALGPAGRPPEGKMIERMVCIQFADGSGMAGEAPPGWEPPSAIPLGGSRSGAPPLGILGLLAAAAVVIGVSVLAFRERLSTPS